MTGLAVGCLIVAACALGVAGAALWMVKTVLDGARAERLRNEARETALLARQDALGTPPSGLHHVAVRAASPSRPVTPRSEEEEIRRSALARIEQTLEEAGVTS